MWFPATISVVVIKLVQNKAFVYVKTWNFNLFECFFYVMSQKRPIDGRTAILWPHRVGKTSFPSVGNSPSCFALGSNSDMESRFDLPPRQEHWIPSQ